MSVVYYFNRFASLAQGQSHERTPADMSKIDTKGPFYPPGLTLIPAWISMINHWFSKEWGDIY